MYSESTVFSKSTFFLIQNAEHFLSTYVLRTLFAYVLSFFFVLSTYNSEYINTCAHKHMDV